MYFERQEHHATNLPYPFYPEEMVDSSGTQGIISPQQSGVRHGVSGSHFCIFHLSQKMNRSPHIWTTTFSSLLIIAWLRLSRENRIETSAGIFISVTGSSCASPRYIGKAGLLNFRSDFHTRRRRAGYTLLTHSFRRRLEKIPQGLNMSEKGLSQISSLKWVA